MGVETELLGLKNRYDGKEFRIVEREDGAIAVLAGDVVIADSGVLPVTASTSDQGNGIVVTLPDGTRMGLVTGNNIAIIGDSRARYGRREWFKGATPDNYDGIAVDFLGCGPAVTLDGSGTLEFRAYDKAFRWAAPSDTAGEWVQVTRAGKVVLQSATVNKELAFILRSFARLPTTDQSLTMTCTGSLYAKADWSGMQSQIMSLFRAGPTWYSLGAGGALTSECVELIDWYNQTISGPGVDVLRLGTNDISNGTITVADMITNATAVFNARIAVGRKLAICGEPARYQTGTTPMTAQQLANLIEYNKALKAYAEARPDSCRYVDLYSVSRDSAYVDGRPAAGILADHVHDGQAGAIAFGTAIKTAIDSLGGCTVGAPPMAGDSSVVFNSGSTWMIGTGGSIGTGASGTAPTGIAAGRASGTDLTGVVSIVSPSGRQGKQIQVDLTSTAAGNVFECNSNLPASSPTLAAVGLAIGDTIEFSVDVELVSGAPTQIEAFLFLAGTNRRAQILFPTTPGVYHCKSLPIKLIPGDTTIRQQFQVTMPASSTASIRFGEFVTRKVDF